MKILHSAAFTGVTTSLANITLIHVRKEFSLYINQNRDSYSSYYILGPVGGKMD